MIIQTIRYRSGLEHDEIQRRFEQRSARYRNVPGLIQKYYVRFPDSGEYGGIYLWDSAASLEAWRTGQLADTLAETYQVQAEPTRELAEVMLVLHPA